MHVSDILYNYIRVVSSDGIVHKLAGISTVSVVSNDMALRFSGDGGMYSHA